MGGRKTYSLDAVVGKSEATAKARKKLAESIESKEPKEIVENSLELALTSDKFVSNLARAAKVLDYIQENAETLEESYESRKRLASKYWANLKEESNIPSDPIVDRIIVDSMAKFIHRGKRE